MSNTIIIGICGQMGTGKDTVASHLVNNHGYTKLAIAQPMKDFLHKVFSFSNDQLYGESAKRNKVDARCFKDAYWDDVERAFYIEHRPFCDKIFPKDPSMARFDLDLWFEDIKKQHRHSLTPRVCLQTLGTSWGQGLAPNVWIDYTLNYIDKRRNHKFVISDVRFLHECNRLVEFGGKLVRLEREVAMLGDVNEHRSEKEVLEVPTEVFAASIANNGNKADLYGALNIIVPALEKSCAVAFNTHHP